MSLLFSRGRKLIYPILLRDGDYSGEIADGRYFDAREFLDGKINRNVGKIKLLESVAQECAYSLTSILEDPPRY